MVMDPPTFVIIDFEATCLLSVPGMKWVILWGWGHGSTWHVHMSVQKSPHQYESNSLTFHRVSHHFPVYSIADVVNISCVVAVII